MKVSLQRGRWSIGYDSAPSAIEGARLERDALRAAPLVKVERERDEARTLVVRAHEDASGDYDAAKHLMLKRDLAKAVEGWVSLPDEPAQ